MKGSSLSIAGSVLLILGVLLTVHCAEKQPVETIPPADLVLTNASVHTMNPDMPTAAAVAVTGTRITAVCQTAEEAQKYIGDSTRVIDLQGAMVTPGIIDGHIHFNRSGALINDANLMTVSDEEGLRSEIVRIVEILDDGEWITAGLWGAYEQWALSDVGEKGGKSGKKWRPHRDMIDELSPQNPSFLCRYDYREWLANTAALEAAGMQDKIINGMVIDRNGKATGVILRPSPAYDMMKKAIQPKSHKRLLDENRAALKALREAGIVEVHDIEKPDQTARFIELQENGELTCRVWLRPDLSRGAELKDGGFTMGLHPKTGEKDSWLRYGALKGYIDGIMGTHGALFFEPYDDQPNNYGHWRPHTSDDSGSKQGNMEKMYGLIKIGIDAGFVPNVHAIGTRGVAEMLDLYERLKNEGVDLTGFRVIHAQVIRPDDFPRFKALGVIAEVNPYHISDDMRWMEERIGYERCKGAYAFKSLLDNGTMLSFGSDWPGTSVAEYHMHPKYLIYAAVSRQTDITVFDRNLLEIPTSEILDTEVLYTIIDGKVVFER